MNEFKLPHVEDLRTDATLIRGLQEDFKAIEQVVTDIYGEIDKMKKQDQEDKNFFNDLYK
ncbi:hypothetical protein [Limosilactobacillus reuteri]|uniref:hypothetical protein n=1 Tax=Limosilactobacillus reuteri TaxID=1598 RepID=UPI0021D19987|nr:hypothetical protein [Limosilactobacillus reuteri]MCU4692492.1 hypothetical protein [Limosilactobacillus reuteri]